MNKNTLGILLWLLIVMAAVALLIAQYRSTPKDPFAPKPHHDYYNDADAYVDFKRFKEGRPCGKVRFMCLPESRDKSWQNTPTQDHIEDLELTPAVEAKFKRLMDAWNRRYEAYEKTRKKDLSPLNP